MNCRRVNRLLSAYIDGELAGVEQLQIQRHLRDCPCCSEEHGSLLTTKRLLSGMRSAATAADLEARILARVSRERSAARRFERALAWWSVETAGWRLRLSFGAVGAAVVIAAVAAAVSPMPDKRLEPRALASAASRPMMQEPAVPVRDIRMLHESWQGPQGAGAYGITAGSDPAATTDPRFQPAFNHSTIADLGPR